MDKKSIRLEYINIRNKIDNKDIKSNIIFNKIIKDKDYINSKYIALYKSLNSEVDTNKLIKYSLDLGKIVLLPRVVDDNLYFYKITYNEKLEVSKFGVEEPLNNIKNLISSDIIDLVIVPGVVFDYNKNRLGFGRGYYDRFLKDLDAITIGICFDEQLSNKLIVDEFDVPVQKVITNKRTIS